MRTLNIFTKGSCRGDSFKHTESCDFDALRAALAVLADEDLDDERLDLDGVCDDFNVYDFSYLFYNVRPTRLIVDRVMDALDNGTMLISTWEECTTGASIGNVKELQKEVKLADAAWMEGEVESLDIGVYVEEVI